jgi:hypothetical protein
VDLTKKEERLKFVIKKMIKILIFPILFLTIASALINGYNPIQHLVCIRENNSYKKINGPPGIRTKYYCIHYYTDAGKKCKSSSECLGNCLLTDETNVVSMGILKNKIVSGYGECESSDRPVTGCSPGTIENPIPYCF